MIKDLILDLEDYFKQLLVDIVNYEELKDYKSRNQFIIYALAVSQMLEFQSGVRFDSTEPEWPVVFIELPTGQISWHIQQHAIAWDGHSTDEKYNRIKQYIKGE